MASQAQQFRYTPNDLKTLEEALSPERMLPYLAMAKGHRHTAILLYERNTYLSEALYGVTQAAEVALRNSIHRTLTGARGVIWFESVNLSDFQRDMISIAQKQITDKRRPMTPAAIVTELSLGFWTSLLSPRSEKNLWVPYLHKIFLTAVRVNLRQDGSASKVKMNRSEIYDVMDRMRSLRNRIAHHESILKLDLDTLYKETLDALTWVCPTSAEWVRSTNCFKERFGRPVPAPPPIVRPAPELAPRPGMPAAR